MSCFRLYLYGRRVVVDSDHKLLQSLSSKPLASVPKDLQCMFLHLQEFNYLIRYRRGVEMHLADTLSRAPLGCQTSEIEEDQTLAECLALVEESSFSDPKVLPQLCFEEVQKETSLDPTWQLLKSITD